MAKIGVFFIVNEEILGMGYEKSEGVHKGSLIGAPEGHETVWRRNHDSQLGKTYDFYPRGRVSYNTTTKQFVIYHDKCLKKEILEQVGEFFELDKTFIRYTIDDYYSCDKCSYSDDDEWC